MMASAPILARKTKKAGQQSRPAFSACSCGLLLGRYGLALLDHETCNGLGRRVAVVNALMNLAGFDEKRLARLVGRHGLAFVKERHRALLDRSEEHTSELQSHSDLV